MRFSLRSVAFEWAAAVFAALLGTALLMVPHNFSFLAPSALREALPLISLVMLAGACGMLVTLVYPLPRAVRAGMRGVVGLALLVLAAGFERSGAEVYGANFLLIGIGLLMTAGRKEPNPPGARVAMAPAVLAAGSLISGLILLFGPLRELNSLWLLTRPQAAGFGFLFLLCGGLLLATIRLKPPIDEQRLLAPTFFGRVLWAAAWTAFLVVAVQPAYLWAPVLFTGVFGTMLLVMPFRQYSGTLVRPTALSTRLALVFALAASLPVIITVAVVTERSQEQAFEDARQALLSQVTIFSEEINQYVSLHRAGLSTLADQEDLLVMAPAERQAVLEQYRRSYPNATSFTLYDAAGVPIASTNPDLLAVPLTGFPNYEAVRSTLQPAYDLLVSPVLQQPVIAFVHPILDAEGNLAGVAGSGLLTARLSEGFNRHGLNTRTAYYLVDSQARAVIQPDSLGGEPLVDLSDLPAVRAYLQSAPESGSLVLPSSHDLMAYRRIPSLGLGLLAVQPDEVALASNMAARGLALLILMFFFLIVTLLSFVLAGRVSRPLAELAYASERLAAGDFSASLPHSGVEEIESLSNTFADMRAKLLVLRQAEAERTAELEAARADLERRVEQRTAELRSTARRLEAVIQALPVGIRIADREGHILEKNELANQVWGLDPAGGPERSASAGVKGWRPESGQPLSDADWALARTLRTGEVILGERVDIERFDGRRATVLNSAAPILDESGRITGGVAVEQDITVQRELEQRASAAAEQAQRLLSELESVFDALTDSVVVYDRDRIARRANARAQEIYGFDPVGMERDAVMERIALRDMAGNPFDHRQLPSARVLRGEKEVKLRLRASNPQGLSFTILAATAPIYMSGELIGAVAIWHDITELQQAIDAEQQLLIENRQQRELLEQLVGEAPVAIAFLQGAEHRYSLANRAYEHLARGKGPLAGRTLAEVWPEVTGQLLPHFDHTYQTGESVHRVDEVLFLQRGDHLEENIFSITLTPILNAAGEVEGVMELAVDNTEEVLARREADVERARLNTLFKYAPEGIVLVDRLGRVLLTNPAFDQLLRSPLKVGENLTTRTALELQGPDGETLTLNELPLARSAFNGETVSNLEVTIRKANGQLHSLLVSSAPVRNEQGTLNGAVGIFQDITARKEMEITLADYASQLERSNQDLQDFAFIASHDLQEPLRKIQAFGSMVEKEYGDRLEENARDYIHRMQDASRRMKIMIDDLLAYSRLATRAQPFKPVDLNHILEDVLSDLEIRLRETGGQVQSGPLPVIEADPSQMRQLLQNLIANALKFHKPGEAPQVYVSARENGGPERRAVLEVADRGIGFDEKHLHLIFQPFQRLHGRGAYEGSGIGLAICRKIVERHGGSITARSQPGEGAVFCVDLPVEQPAAERDAV